MATAPERRSRPKRLLLVTVPSMVTAFVGGLLVLDGQVYFALTGLLLVTAGILMIFKRGSRRSRSSIRWVLSRYLCRSIFRLPLGTDWRWRRRVPDASSYRFRLGNPQERGEAFAAIHPVQLGGRPVGRSDRRPETNLRHAPVCNRCARWSRARLDSRAALDVRTRHTIRSRCHSASRWSSPLSPLIA